jgi:hypothetical protein
MRNVWISRFSVSDNNEWSGVAFIASSGPDSRAC